MLHYSNHCNGIGVDLSEKALAVSEKNAEKLGITAKWLHSDLFEAVEGKFDIIVSNPPYIESAVIETLMPEVKEHEPRMALDGTEDGLFFYEKIIREAGNYLNRNGMLFFEIGYNQAEVVKCFMESGGFTEVVVKKDYAGLDRVVYGTYLG